MMNDKSRQQQKQQDKLTHRPDQSGQDDERLVEIVEVIDSLP